MAITVVVSGDVYNVNTVEDLNNIQSMLTTKFFEQTKNNDAVIEEYLSETPYLEIYDRISDFSNLMDYIVDTAVSNETDYSTLEEVNQALSSMQDAMEAIYNEVRVFT